MNKYLSIAIPTYNRSALLNKNLLNIIDELKETSVAVFISDDSEDYLTKELLIELKSKYKNIFYSKNRSSFGHDKNMKKVLYEPESEYVWLLGDAVLIKSGTIKKILNIIKEHGPELVSFGTPERLTDCKEGIYYNGINIFQNFAWHLTYTGVTIYSRKILDKSKDIDLELYPNFPQIGIIFNGLGTNSSLYWAGDSLITGARGKQSYWMKDAFKTFLNDWPFSISNLPEAYSHQIKNKVLVSHSLNSRLFSFRSITKIRMLGGFNLSIFFRYRDLLRDHSIENGVILLFLSIFPRWILRMIVSIRRMYNKRIKILLR